MFDNQRDHQFGISLTSDFVVLFDEIAMFNDNCSFLCDAFSGIVAQEEEIDERTIRGIDRSSNWIKKKVGEFKQIIGEMAESYGEINDNEKNRE